MPATIENRLEEGIGRLVLSNPGKHNALPMSCWQAIPVAISNLVKDGARVIIVSGAGDSFCAGADISEFDTVRKDAETAMIYEQSNIDAFAALRDAPVPIIAQINGYCLGGGFGLTAACDIRIATNEACFAVPAAKLGLAYPLDAMADIVHAIGTQNTKKVLLTGRRYSASDMEAMGFLGEVTEPGLLEEVVLKLASEIATLAPLTHRATKAAIAAALGDDHALAAELGDATFTSRDYVEGRKAFAEKRKPEFKGE